VNVHQDTQLQTIFPFELWFMVVLLRHSKLVFCTNLKWCVLYVPLAPLKFTCFLWHFFAQTVGQK
jgi:hypothetical protein